VSVAITIGTRSKPQPEPERLCVCNHLESEHGTSGTRPCLATVGDLLNRDFCTCDELRTGVAKAVGLAYCA
jgi:hypothetical protein